MSKHRSKSGKVEGEDSTKDKSKVSVEDKPKNSSDNTAEKDVGQSDNVTTGQKQRSEEYVNIPKEEPDDEQENDEEKEGGEGETGDATVEPEGEGGEIQEVLVDGDPQAEESAVDSGIENTQGEDTQDEGGP